MSNVSIDKYLSHNGHAARSPLDIDASLRVSHEHTDSGLGADQDYAYSSERSNDSQSKYIPGMATVFNRLAVASFPAPQNGLPRAHYMKSSGSCTGSLNGIMKPPPKSILGKSQTTLDMSSVSAFDHQTHFSSRHHHSNVHPKPLHSHIAHRSSTQIPQPHYDTTNQSNPIRVVENCSYSRPSSSGKIPPPQSGGLCHTFSATETPSLPPKTTTQGVIRGAQHIQPSPSHRRRPLVVATTSSSGSGFLINGSAVGGGTLTRYGFARDGTAEDNIKDSSQQELFNDAKDSEEDVGRRTEWTPMNYNNPNQILNPNDNRSHNSTTTHCYIGHNTTDNTLVHTPSRSSPSSPPSSLKLILKPIINSSKR